MCLLDWIPDCMARILATAGWFIAAPGASITSMIMLMLIMIALLAKWVLRR